LLFQVPVIQSERVSIGSSDPISSRDPISPFVRWASIDKASSERLFPSQGLWQ
jgi:hypothetical protein